MVEDNTYPKVEAETQRALIEACERNPDDEMAIARLEKHAADIYSTRLRWTGIEFRRRFLARKVGANG